MHHVHGPDSDALVSFCLGSCEGDIYTLTGPELRNVSEVNAPTNSIQLVKTRPEADCGSDNELLIAKFRLKLRKSRENY